jgi:hypothetical protein
MESDNRLFLVSISSAIEDSEFAGLARCTKTTISEATYVSLVGAIGVSKRGSLLLDLDQFLMEREDRGINVWCEPIGNRNSLRN